LTDLTDPWDEHASWWQEGFTEGSDPEYEEQILPLVSQRLAGSERVLELGTGEGQVARALGAVCTAVVGIDTSAEQLRAARARAGGPSYARASATRLPFGAGSFDAVVACLVLEHVEDLDAVLDETARVLEGGGRFLLLLNHPLLQAPGSGWIDDRVVGEQYWRVGPYLPEVSTLEQVERGVFIRFFHRPLHRYLNGLMSRGLSMEAMEEPPPPPGFLDLAPEYREAATIPRLCVLRARKAGGPPRSESASAPPEGPDVGPGNLR
jgi:SAM-dependent methyltransferase